MHDIFDMTLEFIVHVIEICLLLAYEFELRGLCRSTFRYSLRVSYSSGVRSKLRENQLVLWNVFSFFY